jgi:hypothetical protein
MVERRPSTTAFLTGSIGDVTLRPEFRLGGEMSEIARDFRNCVQDAAALS